MRVLLLFVFFFVIFVKELQSQDQIPSRTVLLIAGVNKTPGSSTDDGYCIGLNVPIPFRFHVGLIGRYRPVQPRKVSWSVAIERAMFHYQKHQVNAIAMIGKYYGGDHTQFDYRYWKCSLGAGYRAAIWKRTGVGIQVFPWSSYLNSRKDKPAMKTPRQFQSYELFLYVSYLFKN